jgi:hypothetical protein
MKIPTLDSQVVGRPPDMSSNFWAIRQAEEGMNRISQGISDVGKVLGSIAEEKKRISNATQLSELRVNAENEWITQKAEFDKKNTDPDTYYQEASTLYDKSIEKISKQAKGTEVQQKFKIMMQEHKVTVLDSLGREASQKWLDHNIAGKMDVIDTFVDLSGKASDPDIAKSYKETARGIIRSMSGNLLHETQALTLEKSKMQELDEAAVKNHILIDPLGAAKELAGDGYPDLSPKDRPYYKAQAKVAMKAQDNENEDAQVNLIVKKLLRAYPNDYETMQKRLDDMDYMEQNFGKDIHVQVIKKASLDIAERRMRFDEVKKDISEKVAKDTWLNLGKMTSGEIARRVREDGLDWKRGEEFKNMLLNPSDQKSDPASYVKMYGRIIDGVEPRTMLETDVMRGPFSRSDKMELGRLIYRDEDKIMDANIKTGHEIIKGQLGPKTDVLGRALPFSMEEGKLYYNAIQVLDEAIKTAKQNKKPLTIKEITEKAFEISSTFRMNLTQKSRARSIELMGRGNALVESATKIPQREPGETPEAYLKRIHGEVPVGRSPM